MPLAARFLGNGARDFGHDRSRPLIYGRYLFLRALAAVVVTIGVVKLVGPEWVYIGLSPIIDSTFGIVLYISTFAFLLPLCRFAKIRTSEFFPNLGSEEARWSIGMACALIAVSFGALYVLYLPLSFVRPDFVEFWLLAPEDQLFWLEGDYYLLANAVSLITLVVVGPVVEEFLFRGLLLRTWISKWGVRRAIVISSVLFAALHVDFLGAFIFSVVVSLSYLWSRRLEVPILIHMTNNLIAAFFEGGYLIFWGTDEYTVADFQAEWWTGVLGLIVGVPLLIWLLRKGARAAVTPT